MAKLKAKIALITGGNSGIGLATAKQFVNEGAYVFITGRRKPELDVAVKEIGRNVTAVQGDVSNLAPWGSDPRATVKRRDSGTKFPCKDRTLDEQWNEETEECFGGMAACRTVSATS